MSFPAPSLAIGTQCQFKIEKVSKVIANNCQTKNNIETLCGRARNWVVLFLCYSPFFVWNEEQLTIYDSALQRIPTIARNVQERLRRLLPIQRGTEVTAFFPRVQQQANGFDCGVHAIATVADLITGRNVQTTNFNRDRIRPALLEFFETLKLSAFPTTVGRPRAPAEALTARFRM